MTRTEERESGLRRFWVPLLAFISIVPAFVDIATAKPTILGYVTGQLPSGPSTSLHIASVLVPLLAIGVFLRYGLDSFKGRAAATPVAILIVMLSLSILVGSIAAGAGKLGWFYYFQTMLPTLAWFIGASRGASVRTLARAILTSVLICTSLVHFLTRSLLGGASTEATAGQLAAAIPQYKSFFPVVIAIGMSFALAFLPRMPLMSGLVLLSALTLLPQLWSRTGLIAILASSVAVLLNAWGQWTARVQALMMIALSGLSVLILTGLTAGGVLSQRLQSGEIQASDERRVELAFEGLSRILARPLLGDMFVPYSDLRAGGQLADFARLFPAHNQYMDLALRGGLLALLAYVAMLFALGKASWLGARDTDRDADFRAFSAALFGVVAVLVIVSFTHLVYIQTWTGVLAGLLLGVGGYEFRMIRGIVPPKRNNRVRPALSSGPSAGP